MIKLFYLEIEAHFTKSNPPCMPPRLWEKGVSAEADAVACIRLAVRRISVVLSHFALSYHSIHVFSYVRR